MEFLESVEEGLEKAKEFQQNIIGDQIDPQNEQDKAECEAEGVQDHPDYILSDPSNLQQEAEVTSTALFKTITIDSDNQLIQLTHMLDADQKLVLSFVLNYSRQIQISRKRLPALL